MSARVSASYLWCSRTDVSFPTIWYLRSPLLSFCDVAEIFVCPCTVPYNPGSRVRTFGENDAVSLELYCIECLRLILRNPLEIRGCFEILRTLYNNPSKNIWVLLVEQLGRSFCCSSAFGSCTIFVLAHIAFSYLLICFKPSCSFSFE